MSIIKSASITTTRNWQNAKGHYEMLIKIGQYEHPITGLMVTLDKPMVWECGINTTRHYDDDYVDYAEGQNGTYFLDEEDETWYRYEEDQSLIWLPDNFWVEVSRFAAEIVCDALTAAEEAYTTALDRAVGVAQAVTT